MASSTWKKASSVKEHSERELVLGCRREERQAQEDLYGRFSRRMFAVCLRYARHEAEAEDLLQEGFIRVFDKLSGFRMQGSLEGWIRRIMVHTCINHHRKSSVRNEVLGTENRPERTVAPVAMANLGQQELLQLVQNLPEGYRMVFNLFAIEGYDHAAIADLLGCTESTSRSQLAKARRMLQKQIGEHGRLSGTTANTIATEANE
ncbi:MAG: sigma-70 family RNA polymerase sigma factor [Flavobacteriales bacterium]|nr:sigma-70 family RNA polymerase sigma factor [Flavobacteriales bacterium]